MPTSQNAKIHLKPLELEENSAVLEHFLHKVKYRENATAPTTSNSRK